jgi:hypothetical protein
MTFSTKTAEEIAEQFEIKSEREASFEEPSEDYARFIETEFTPTQEIREHITDFENKIKSSDETDLVKEYRLQTLKELKKKMGI